MVHPPGEGPRAARGEQKEESDPEGQAAQARRGGSPKEVAVHRLVSFPMILDLYLSSKH